MTFRRRDCVDEAMPEESGIHGCNNSSRFAVVQVYRGVSGTSVIGSPPYAPSSEPTNDAKSQVEPGSQPSSAIPVDRSLMLIEH